MKVKSTASAKGKTIRRMSKDARPLILDMCNRL